MMLKNRVIPCLLLRGRGLVKTQKFNKFRYVGDPINTVKIFNTKEVDELVILDIDATRKSKAIDFDFLEDITSECFMPLAYGGGIQTIDEISRLFSMGIEKVIINSQVFSNPSLIEKAAKIYGSQSIVVSIDAQKHLGRWRVYSHSATLRHNITPEQHAINSEELGAGEIFLNCVERDGTNNGYNIPLIKRLTAEVSLPVTVCGGASSIEDFVEAVKLGGASAVSAGSMFVFHGPLKGVLINYPTYKSLELAFSGSTTR